MRDIGARIHRYRLRRFAPPGDRLRRRLRWAWVVMAAWLAWVGLVSEHNFYRLWKMTREDRDNRVAALQLGTEVERMDREANDPRARRRSAEAYLRESAGMAKKGEIIYKYQEPRP